MITITIVDIVEQAPITGSRYYCIVCVNKEITRMMPIWVCSWEGIAIAAAIRGKPIELTHHEIGSPTSFKFMTDILKATEVSLLDITIDQYSADNYSAVARFRNGEKMGSVSCRTSDGIALALRAGSPILIGQQLFERLSVPIPRGKKPRGRGIDAIVRQWDPSTIYYSDAEILEFVFE